VIVPIALRWARYQLRGSLGGRRRTGSVIIAHQLVAVAPLAHAEDIVDATARPPAMKLRSHDRYGLIRFIRAPQDGRRAARFLCRAEPNAVFVRRWAGGRPGTAPRAAGRDEPFLARLRQPVVAWRLLTMPRDWLRTTEGIG
jgi:hypothetical protein